MYIIQGGTEKHHRILSDTEKGIPDLLVNKPNRAKMLFCWRTANILFIFK